MEQTDGDTVNLYNARPDCIAKLQPIPSVIPVGEVESSPFMQMVVASLGQIATDYMLGVILTKAKTMQIFIKKAIQ